MTYCRCSSPVSTHPPRPDPSYRSTHSHKSRNQNTSAVQLPMLSRRPCRNMAPQSKTSAGTPRCMQTENQPSRNSQRFGRMNSLKLPLRHPTRFSPRFHTSWSNSPHKKMRKVRCRRMSFISKILWRSGNLSRSLNTPSRLSLGMIYQRRGCDGRATFFSIPVVL